MGSGEENSKFRFHRIATKQTTGYITRLFVLFVMCDVTRQGLQRLSDRLESTCTGMSVPGLRQSVVAAFDRGYFQDIEHSLFTFFQSLGPVSVL